MTGNTTPVILTFEGAAGGVTGSGFLLRREVAKCWSTAACIGGSAAATTQLGAAAVVLESTYGDRTHPPGCTGARHTRPDGA